MLSLQVKKFGRLDGLQNSRDHWINILTVTFDRTYAFLQRFDRTETRRISIVSKLSF